MKKLLIPLVAGMVSSCLNISTNAQQHTENIRQEFTVQNQAEGNTLYIYNVFGSIQVEGYSGDKVLFEVEKTITADDNKTLELGKQEVKLGFEQKQDSIIGFIAQPFDSRPNRSRNNNIDIDYGFKLNYKVRVPKGMNLKVSTVNDGEIVINDVSGNLHINNVNEGITVKNAAGQTRAHTVNGDIIVNYVKNPTEACSYNTINGTIRVTYLSDFSADLQFKSMNGEFYTDFPQVETLPATAVKNQESKGGKMVYKLSKTNTIRFGNGGKVFKFETLNGDVYIKKQS